MRRRQRIPVKTPEQQEEMREACRLTAQALLAVGSAIRPGVTTAVLDEIAGAFIASAGASAAFNGYRGFPADTCISINDELIHGIPGPRRLAVGDIVSVDLGVRRNGFFGDATRTFLVGAVPGDLRRLVETAKEAFAAACDVTRAGVRVGDISHAIQSFCEGRGYGIVRDYVGHGIGVALHEPPQIPNFGRRGEGPLVPAGATLAIEPMITLGSYKVRVLDDKWTVVTADGLPCAHYENTVLVTDSGCEVLTVAAEQPPAL